MRKLLLSVTILLCSVCLYAQNSYDSVTISRFIEKKPADGPGWDKIKHAGYPAVLAGEHTVWVNAGANDKTLYIISLANRIRENGTKSLARCFIPRHSINFYREGKIALYLLICFECNGMEFSDMPLTENNLLVSEEVRMQQIEELKILFKDYL